MRHTIRNDAQIGNLLECLHQLENCSVTFDSNVEEISRIVFVIQGNPSAKQISLIATAVLPNIRQITRAWNPPYWHDGVDGINQLIALALMQNSENVCLSS